jgi:NAD(P)-dependent dehydrogenase (short-subunit alcohol dehydrogenase family)
MGRLAGRRALITGAASGIGRAIALLFAQEGAAVAVADLDEAGGEEVVQAITVRGGQAIFILCNVAQELDCQRAISLAVDELDGLDILVNNAGIIRRTTVLDTTEEDWDQVMAVNVKSVYLLSRFAIPAMVRAGGGAIINMGSGWGLTGGRSAAAYCASKGAVVQLTRAMAIDHGPHNVRVNCVCPGDTDTPMLADEAEQLGEPRERFMAQAADRPLGRVGTPEEIARAVLYLASEEASFITGAVLVVDGGGLAG